MPKPSLRQSSFRLLIAIAAMLVTAALVVPRGAHAANGTFMSVTKTASPATFSGAGQTITYTYVVTDFSTDPSSFADTISVTDDKVTPVTCPGTTLAAGASMTCTGSYITTAADVAARSITNTVTVTAKVSTDHIDDTATTTLTIAYNGSTITQQVIARFLSHRMSLTLNEGPDRARFVRRVPESLWGDDDSANSNAPFNFAATSNSLGSRMVFSTSLRQIARANAKADRAHDSKSALPDGALAYAAPRLPFKASPRLAPDPGFDVWMEAHYLRFGSRLGNVDNDGNFGILYVGADRLVTPSVLLGALVQIDWMNESSAAASSSASGKGAMAGPYVSVRLAPNLFFDARGAWGLSANDVNPLGTYTDNFSTDRWLAHAKLTGNWRWQDFRLTPSVAIDYMQEHQRAYTDSQGTTIPGQTLSLGRLSFGPEIARRFTGADGTSYEPLAALVGQWDFDRPEVASLAGLPVSVQALHAQAQAGLQVHQPQGLTMRLVATYDGIGDSSLHAYGGQFWLSLPLN
jgi:outer membrane autotransporter protein